MTDLDARLAALAKAYDTASAATTTTTAAHEKLAKAQLTVEQEAAALIVAHQRHAEVMGIVTAAEEKTAAAASAMGRAFAAAGLEGEAAFGQMYAASRGLEAAGLSGAAGMTRMVQGVDALNISLLKGAGPLIAIVAGLAAVGAAVTYLKSAADEAGNFQLRLDLMAKAIKSQGGDWRNFSDEVRAWASLQEETTRYTADEAINALRLFTAAGIDAGDGMKIVRIAEDAAAASGKSLEEVSHGLFLAHQGNYRALVTLGVATKAQIKDGMDYKDALAAVEKHSGDAATLTGDYADQLTKLGHTMDETKRTVGEHLIPSLQALFDEVNNNITSLGYWNYEWDAVTKDMAFHWEAFVEAITRSVSDAGNAMDLFFHGKFKDAAMDAKNSLYDLGQAISQVGKIGVNFAAIDSEAEYIRKKRAELNKADTSVIGDPQIGGTKTGSGSGFASSLLEDAIGQTPKSKYADQFKGTQQSITDLTRSEEGLATAVKLATTEAGLHSAELALNQAKVNDAKTEIGLLTTAITTERTELENETKARDESKTSYENARVAYNAFSASLDGQTKLTDAQKDKLKELKLAVDDSKKSYEQHSAAVSELSAYIDKNIGLLDKAKQALFDVAEASAKAALAWDQFKTKTDQSTSDALATIGMSNADKAAYYKFLFDETAATADNLQLREQLYQKYSAAVIGMDTDQLKSNEKLLAAQQAWADKAAGFLDSFFTKGKQGTQSFADAWKKMLADMEQALLKSALSKMLLGMFQDGGQFAGLGALFGMPQGQASSAGSAAGANASQGGVFGALLGPAAAASIASSLPSSGGALGMLFGSSAPSPTSGSAGAGTASILVTHVISTGSGPIAVPGSTANVYGVPSSSSAGAAGGMDLSKLMADKTIGKGTIGSALVGIMAGQAFGDMMGGGSHPFWGSVGGAIGSIFGPVGGVIGGAIGSLFGHADNQGKMPDKYNTGSFGQGMADFSGAGVNGVPQFNANGQGFSESPSLYTSLNKMGMGAFIGSYIAKTGGTGLTPSELAEFRGTQGNLVSLKDGYLTLDNGRQIWWETLISDAQDAVTRIQGAGGLPVFDVSHSFPDYAGSSINAAGNYIPGSPAGAISSTPTPPTSGGGAAPPIGRVLSPGSTGGVNVTVNIGGSLLTDQMFGEYVSKILGDVLRSGPAASMSSYSRTF